MTRAGSHRPTAANSTRPAVTMAQNAASASEAWVADAPRPVVISSWDQLPFIVSQMAWATANAAYSQNRAGSPCRPGV